MDHTLDRTRDNDDAYWRDEYRNRPYVDRDASYDDYAPAYGYGRDAWSRYRGREWDDVESDLGRDWDRVRGRSNLTWERAKHAVKDAWHRMSNAVERAMPGDSDRDGR